MRSTAERVSGWAYGHVPAMGDRELASLDAVAVTLAVREGCMRWATAPGDAGCSAVGEHVLDFDDPHLGSAR